LTAVTVALLADTHAATGGALGADGLLLQAEHTSAASVAIQIRDIYQTPVNGNRSQLPR
jgi:hypothetical protein